MCTDHDHSEDRQGQSLPEETTASGITRRGAITAAAVAAVAAPLVAASPARATDAAYAEPAEPALPPSTMTLEKGRVALVVVDPQIDFLSEKGVAWGVVGESVTEHGVVDNLDRLFRAAKEAGVPVLISPHYYYPQDHRWAFEGALEKVMHSISMFDRPGPLDLTGLAEVGG